jgi:hypothetical protein
MPYYRNQLPIGSRTQTEQRACGSVGLLGREQSHTGATGLKMRVAKR